VIYFRLPPKNSKPRTNLVLAENATSHVTLAEVVLDSSLLGTGGHGEGSGATEWASEGSVLEADDADVVRATSGTRAGHASWHLDLHWEVGGLGSRETANSDAGNVLGDFSILERSWVGTSGCGIDLGGQWAGTILVDLVEGHGDLTAVGAGWQTSGSTLASGLGNTLFGGALGSLLASTGCALGSLLSKLTLVVGSWCGTTHEGGDCCTGIDWAVAGTSKSGSLAGAHLTSADDGGIGLRAAAWGCAVTWGAIGNRETRHDNLVSTLDFGDDTMGGDRCHEGSENVRVLHFGLRIVFPSRNYVNDSV